MSRRGSAAAAGSGAAGLWSDAAAGPGTPLRGDDSRMMELGSRRPTLTKPPCYRYPAEAGYSAAESGYGDECGLLSCRPRALQRFASIKVFVLLLSLLVTLQQALSSGYLNSVITTIEKRYEIPSSLTGVIASFYEIGNMLTVIFVSYLGSRRHVPVWIGRGIIVMGLGSLLFSVPHFLTDSYSLSVDSNSSSVADNVCRPAVRRDQYRQFEQITGIESIDLSRDLASPPLSPHNNLHGRCDNCIDGTISNLLPVLIFMLAQLLLGSGGSPLFTLGTTYIDDHVPRESSSFYIGCMYSMVAFGPVLGFLLGAYMLSHHVDAFSGIPLPDDADTSDPRWVGMWWGGFLICGIGMFVLGAPFFLFPKSLECEKQRVREEEKAKEAKRQHRAASRGSEEHFHHFRQRHVSEHEPHGHGGHVHGHAARGHRRTASSNVVIDHSASKQAHFKPGHRRTLSNPTEHEYRSRLRHMELAAQQKAAQAEPAKNVYTVSQTALSKTGPQRALSQNSFHRGHRRTKSNVSQVSRVSQHSVRSARSNYGRDVKDLPKSMWKLVCNPIYVVTCLGACMELMIVSGFIVFLPKYLETQFSLSKSQASVFAGGIAIPGACMGVFMGGYILKRLQLRPKGAVQLILIFQMISLAMYSVLFVVGCDNVKMAGATAPYSLSSRQSPEMFSVNLTASCNFGCDCDRNEVEPVCGTNGLTYFSPCHAGCTTYSAESNYTNCACINEAGNSSSQYAEITMVPVATPGSCSRACSNALPFMVLLFFMTFVVAITQMPLLMIVLRSVDEEERAFALGMQFVIFRLFAYIPSPILFGNVIDSTCVLWKSQCGERAGRCLIYDIEVFRFKYVGICAGLKVLSLIIFLLDWFMIRWKYKLDMNHTMTVGDIVNSIISVDRGYREVEVDEAIEEEERLACGDEPLAPRGSIDSCDSALLGDDEHTAVHGV
ncbi:solute carrier organic anion transporter family member 5A1-like isoform X2 [Amphibalanus amphitrite]|uniref:solute carrier organic anion transporter family member 5A1-like isoform X2 n=1 Tax=Amphibalanus amphitrite TaxID=1232801 RepID=UPI001C91FFDF|nr:solute carrier organic anion transporter family member 5A1-like isoform X2 [Amphibalanus amphitrite]XP_043213023.1 solute carrier organic anion transporter family member 5A1-like isoform X2 [Amphibalanus amphitrite]